MADYEFSYTGPNMNAYFGTIKELYDNGYIFKGVATPTTNPGTPTEKIAYIASEAGTYTNFGSIVLTAGLYILTYNGSTWSSTSLKDLAFKTGQVLSDTGIIDYIKANNNDLVTGKAVFDKLAEDMEAITRDVSSLLDTTRHDRWIDGNTFASSTAGKHVAIPIADNDTQITIKAHSTRGSYYVFVKSYTIPTGADSFDLCSGETGRKSIAANTQVTLTLPGDCKYVIIGISNSSSNSYKPQLVTITSYSSIIPRLNKFSRDLFNNSLRTSMEDPTTTSEEYEGDVIRVNMPNKKHYFTHWGWTVNGVGTYTPSGGTAKAQQGLAIWGKYAFFTYHGGYIQIVDLTTSTIIAAYDMPEGVCQDNNHAGNANFCGVFYDASDDFPLLYVSSYLEHKCYVLRVTLSGCTLVQEIYVSLDGTQTPDTGTWHFYPDNDGRIILHGNYGYALGILPSISSATAYVNLQECEILRGVGITGYTSAGAAALNGKLYMNIYTLSTPHQYTTILVYNYEQKRKVSKLIVPSNIHNREFEGLAFYEHPSWGGMIIVGYNNWGQFMGYRFY